MAANQDAAALTLRGVRHHYGRHCAVDGVSLTVAPGEVLCLLGPSGCGKTTLLRLAAGLEALQTGAIAVAGREVAGPGFALAPEARKVGLMFQDYALFPHLRVAGNVGFGLAGRAAAARRARVRQVLDQVGLTELANAWPHQLSGGQQQRVALARALAPEPQVMLLDEPFSGLDLRLRTALRADILRVLKESGAAALMVTHDPEEAMLTADRIAVMREGRIEQCGPPATLYDRPATAFVAAFLGEANRFDATVRGGTVATPIGRLATPGLAEGLAVEVLVRPEALRLSPLRIAAGRPARPDAGSRARVLALRFVGPTTRVQLCPEDGRPEGSAWTGRAGNGHEAGEPSVQACLPGRCRLAPGDSVALEVDVEQVFVFPLSGAAGRDAEAAPPGLPEAGEVFRVHA